MDIDALHSALLSITVVSEKLVQRAKCSRLREMRLLVWESFFAKSKTICEWPKPRLAANSDSALCPRCWPPELVATDLDGELNCPVCGRISHEQAA